MFSLRPRPFVQSSFDMQAFRQPHVFFFLFLFFEDDDVALFLFVPFSLSLCMESTSDVLFFRVVFFLPCGPGLNFLHQFM